MLFWIVIATLTAAVAVLLVRPLWRTNEDTYGGGSEDAVYRDQMRELEREKASGLINPEEAENARAEIGRRLLAANAVEGRSPAFAAKTVTRRFSAFAIIALLPAGGLCLYLMTGSPGVPDQPLEVRLANPGNDMSLLVARAERHLAQNPQDGTGWDVLAPIYFRAQRIPDAELAYRNAIRIIGPSPERLTGLGETIMAANGGIVTFDARTAFEEALKLQPGNPRARFYSGLAHEQAGQKEQAVEIFTALLKESPPNAPWVPLVREHLAQSGAGANEAQPGPGAAEIAAAQEMAPADREAMILGMVESLDARLKNEPGDFEGWMRLVRSWTILKENDKALSALRDGLKVFAPESTQGQQLLSLAKELGLPPEGTTP